MFFQRMKFIAVASAVAALSIMVILVSGCTKRSSPSSPDSALLERHRARLLLTEEPAGALAVLDVRAMLTGVSWEPDHESGTDESGEASEGELEFTLEDVTEEAHEEVEIDPATIEPQDVVMVGTIGGMPNPWKESEPAFPFKENAATVFMLDPGTAAEMAETAHDHGADVCDCPFCARHAKDNVNSLAAVNFLDSNGELINIDAGQLLNLKENDTVVVRGTAKMLGGEMLVVDAEGIYPRR